MSAPDIREGGCLCGAVRLRAELPGPDFGACHCTMCRRWTGSALLAMTVPVAKVEWLQGEAQITRYQSSDWAERAFCRLCGSGLWYRVNAPELHAEVIEIPVGLFDDADGLAMTSEIYIDRKPDSWAFAGEGRKVMTEQQCIDAWALPGSQQEGSAT